MGRTLTHDSFLWHFPSEFKLRRGFLCLVVRGKVLASLLVMVESLSALQFSGCTISVSLSHFLLSSDFQGTLDVALRFSFWFGVCLHKRGKPLQYGGCPCSDKDHILQLRTLLEGTQSKNYVNKQNINMCLRALSSNEILLFFVDVFVDVIDCRFFPSQCDNQKHQQKHKHLFFD